MQPLTAEMLAGIESWVRIETHTPDVADVNRLMRLVADSFATIGARVVRVPGRDGSGDHLSIASDWGGDGPGVLVLCHLDTVHPKGTLAGGLPFRVEGDRAYGPGIYDMKACAYLAFAALRELVRARTVTPLPIRMLYTSDEEIGSPTSRALIEREAARAKYVLVVEPAREGGRIVTARKGVGRYVLTAHGRAAHAGGRHQDGRSAIVEIARHIVAIEARTDYARGLTFNVGQVRGGTADNVVPQTCSANIDMRVVSLADAAEMDRYFTTLQPFDPDIRLEVAGDLNRPPFETNAGVARLFEHARGLAQEIGIDLQGMHAGGGSDGNFTAHLVPTLDGLGADGAEAHTHGEHILLSSLVPRMTLLRRLFETLA